MKVCIAEKPSVAREIAYILGAKSRKDGFFEGNGYQVTWTFGHLCMLKLPDDYQADWKKWTLNSLPMLPEKFETKLITQKGVKKQFGIIKKLFKSASIVINCGDAGQEGELIQRWVMEQAKYKGKVQRLWISSLTPEAIKSGFRNLKDASDFDNLYYAGMSRAIGDWLLGMNATRLYTVKHGGYKQVLSVGRVQTPTLAMIVERFKEIQNFVPSPYWDLQTTYREVVFNYQKGRFLKKEEGQKVLEKITSQPFKIISFDKKKGKESPPRLFDLTSLQVFCNRRFSYSADQTLKLVQKLYEQKLVTYPRVDTTYLPNDVYPKIHGILSKMTNYSQFTQSLLNKTIRKSSKVFNDKKVTDHHAIIPTGVQKSLPANEQNVYDAIARQFIAAFYPDCIVSNTTVIGEAATEKFKATGKEILEEAWRVLFPKKAKKDHQKAGQSNTKKAAEEKILPEFKAGETGEHRPALLEKMTQPPKNYTEATLLRAMETAGKKVDDDELRELMKENGIGRPSTRANIIETLFRRKYIERQKKLVTPTSIGIQLIEAIHNDLLKSAELTGKWEKQLRDIASGAYFAKQFIFDMKKMVSELVEEVKFAENTLKIESPAKKNTFVKKQFPKKKKVANPLKKSTPKKTTSQEDKLENMSCPKCFKGKLLKGNTAYGCNRWKEKCDFRLPFKFMEKRLPQLQLQRLMKMGSTIQLKGFKKEGKKVDGKLRFEDNFNLKLELKNNVNQASKSKTDNPAKKTSDTMPCPKCNTGIILKGNSAYGCSRWQEGCDFRFSFENVRKKAGGKSLTKDLVLSILSKKS